MNNLDELDDLMMVELNENFLEKSVFTTHDIDKDDQEAMKAYIKLIALLISSEKPGSLFDSIIPTQTAEVTTENDMSVQTADYGEPGATRQGPIPNNKTFQQANSKSNRRNKPPLNNSRASKKPRIKAYTEPGPNEGTDESLK